MATSVELEAAFRAVPETMVAEILGGELYTHGRPAPREGMAVSVLAGELHGPFRRGHGGPGGWVLIREPEIHLGPERVVPDLVGWRRARMPDEIGTEAHYTLAPDWICEVLSAGTEATARVRKMRIYLRERVGHVWLLNPTTRTLEVYRLEDGRWILLDTHEGATTVRAVPFEAFELDLSLLWKP